jgi:tetratricopeptide (TPR) repeat protein
MFVPGSTAGTNKFASQPEQMHESRCFSASSGRLGCISCHDPHVMPAAAEKAAYYRNRCLGCHSDQSCRSPETARESTKPADDCIACHMPRASSSNNAHVATTNHRIPRRQDADPKSSDLNPSDRAYLASLVHFHRDRLRPDELTGTDRDRAIALCRSPGDVAAAMALPLLEAAVAARTEDLAALESLGEVHGRLRRPAEGLVAYQQALARDPIRQTALEGAAHLAYKAGRNKESVDLWKRAIAVNPWRTDYHADLALAAMQVRDWQTATTASREALRLNPGLLTARAWLVQCYLHLGDREAASREFQTLLSFDPPNRDELLRRFTALSGTQ